MIRAADYSARIEAQSVLLEWRSGELRICSGDVGELSGMPFPRRDLELCGFVLERQRNGAAVTILCKHLEPTAEDGQDGTVQKKWRIVRRLHLSREGVYKFEARRWQFVPSGVLAANYQSIGQNGHTVYVKMEK